MRQASSGRLMKVSQLWCRNTQLGVARDTSKHFLEGAKDRERRVRLAARGCRLPYTAVRPQLSKSWRSSALEKLPKAHFYPAFYEDLKVWKMRRNPL